MVKITKLDDIQIYKESLRLTQSIFDLCKNPVLRKEFSLCNQIKRASISICANIAEGFGRNSKRDFAQFLSVALGSCNETIALLDVIQLNFPRIKTELIKDDYQILSKRIFSFRKHLLS